MFRQEIASGWLHGWKINFYIHVKDYAATTEFYSVDLGTPFEQNMAYIVGGGGIGLLLLVILFVALFKANVFSK